MELIPSEGSVLYWSELARNWSSAFTFLVALSRVVLDLHYPSDVLAGAVLGGAIAGAQDLYGKSAGGIVGVDAGNFGVNVGRHGVDFLFQLAGILDHIFG